MSKTEIKKSVLKFPVIFEKVEDVFDGDTRFTKVKIWLMHLGENFNGSDFEKGVVDTAIPTLGYIPIVAFLEKNKAGEKDCSDHRYIIVKDAKGVRRKYKGTAYGVITSSADNNAHYEERLCDDGETRTFLVVDGLLWNMFEDSSEIMQRDVIKAQSMELWDDGESIDGYEDENGIFHFTKFSFRAACILGDDFEPAMINSTIEVQFTMNDFVKNLQYELNDKFTAFTKLVNEKTNQGGIEMPNTTEQNTDFAQTVLQQFEDISAMVSNHESLVDRWGDSRPRYYAVDIQENEVIVVDRSSNYNYFGFAFTMNGDKAEIDFTSGKRKKLSYQDYVDGSSLEGGFDFGKHIEEIENNAFTKVEEANGKVVEAENAKNAAETNYENAKNDYEQVKADYDEMKPKYDAYVTEDNNRKEAEIDAKKDAEFAKYEATIGECTEFTALKEKKAEMTVEEIESQCAILFARKSLAGQINFSKSDNGAMTAGIVDTGDDNNGFANTRYGRIAVSR